MWIITPLLALLFAQQPQADPRAILKQYCFGCHNQQMKQRGSVPVALDTLDASNVGADAKTWEMVVRKMRAGVMPPAGMPRPDKATHDGFLTWLEGQLDRDAGTHANPGRTEPVHRLNRSEYQNAVRDLLDLEIDVSSLLPPDDGSYGFDNIAGVLKISPTLMERYLAAAQKISRAAVGVPPPFPTVDYFRLADDLAQDDRLPGQLFGTRGGMSIRYTFPMDAYYAIRVQLSRDLNEQVPIYVEPQHLELSIDGERVQLFTLAGAGAPAPPPPAEPVAAGDDNAVVQPPPQRGARPASPAGGGNRQGQEVRNRADRDWEIRVPVKAGVHSVQVAFINQSSAVAETARLPFFRPYPAGVNIAETRTGAYLRSVEISGPYDPAGPGDSRSRRRIFVCRVENLACAKTILSGLARRAYRRPVGETDLQPLLDFYREGRKEENSFDHGIERALRRLLVSPEFLFRVETDPPNVAPNSSYRLSDIELASRLSFFLWSSIPDDELLRLAEQNRLRDPAVLELQVRRMIADSRFSSFVEKFAGQWLFLRNLPAVVPVQQNFPDFDDTLRQSFRRETELFFESVVREDRSALDLLRADYTFLNERLARHYGIPNVKGSRFRRVTLMADTKRGGLLRQGSILTVTSYPDGADPNAAAQGWTALHQVAWSRRPNRGFNLPRPVATGRLDSLDLVRKLAARGADINARMTKEPRDGNRNMLNRIGATPFVMAAKAADVPLMRVLLACGADQKIKTADGTSALMVAAGVGIYGPGESPGTHEEALEAVKLAYEVGGGDVNDVNKDGETALHGAVYRGGAVPVIQFLADKGAKLDVENKKKWTPLLAAEGVVYASSGIRRYPEAAALIRKLMRDRGLPIPEFERNGGAAPIIKTSAEAVTARTNWDGVYTDAQAQRGQQVYQRSCAVCHLDNLQGDSVSPTLVGPTFMARFTASTAHEMVQSIRSTMPQNAPDTLGDRAYVDLISYLLKVNGSRAGTAELPLDVAELEKIIITDQPPGR